MIIGIEATHANKKYRTGVEEYCFQIIQNLKKIIPHNYKVVLYSNSILIDELSVLPENWECKILPWPFRKGWSQFRLSFEFLKFKPDVFFAPGQLVPIITPPNTITMIHDSAFKAYPQVYNFWGRQYLKLMNLLIIKKSKLILTSTEFNRQELIKFYGKNISKKIIVIPLAFNNEKFTTSNLPSAEILEKYKISKPYIISIGRLETKKNAKRIIESFNILKKEYPDLSLVLIGKPGVGYAEILEAWRNSLYQKDIILSGWVKEPDIVVLLSGAEVFVFPSLYEGFGIPILEALAVGVPIVASRGTSLEEVGGESGIYADPQDIADIADKIKSLLKSSSFREQKINMGWERSKEFSWEKTVRETWKALLS